MSWPNRCMFNSLNPFGTLNVNICSDQRRKPSNEGKQIMQIQTFFHRSSPSALNILFGRATQEFCRRRQYKYVSKLTSINYISSDYHLETVTVEKSLATATKFSFDEIVFALNRFPRIDENIVK